MFAEERIELQVRGALGRETSLMDSWCCVLPVKECSGQGVQLCWGAGVLSDDDRRHRSRVSVPSGNAAVDAVHSPD